ncbi:MAG: hypothetical protein Q9191_004525 [Dirinaria sp. TL-2023a]
MATNTAAMPTLLTLPREIRDSILELLLLEKNMLFPYDYKPCACDCPKNDRKAPHTSVLRVNKQLHTEGNEILYGRGIFVLSTCNNFIPFFNAGEPLCMHAYPTEDEMYRSRHLIQNISLIGEPEIMGEARQHAYIQSQWNLPAWQTMTPRQRRQIFHENGRVMNSIVWENDLCVLESLESLSRLILDIGSIFCPQGCCRMVNAFAKAAKVLGQKEISVAVRGQYEKGENAKIVRAIKKGGVADAEDLGESDDEDEEMMDGEGS